MPHTKCTHCGAIFKVPADADGKRAQCKQCLVDFRVEFWERNPALRVEFVPVVELPKPVPTTPTSIIITTASTVPSRRKNARRAALVAMWFMLGIAAIVGVAFVALPLLRLAISTPVKSVAAIPDRPNNPPEKVQEFAAPKMATGIKERVLLAVMNHKSDDPKYQHTFKSIGLKDDGGPDRTSIYKDENNEIYLVATGSPDDLTLIQLLMPLDDFTNGFDDDSFEGAAAFGRCVQRLGGAADPSWMVDLYNLMNENLPRILLMPEGITTRRKTLMAKFRTYDAGDKKRMISMAIGIPAEEGELPEQVE